MPNPNLYTLEHINEQWTATDQATLLFVVSQNKVLLIRKKRGLGAGKINGPGGKLEPGETPQQCAHREIQEELCIRVSESQKMGRLKFQFVDGYSIDVHAFVATKFEGTPTETDEAAPLWFEHGHIPYNEMWADDRIWLPKVLAGDTVAGRFVFLGDTLLEHEVVFKVDLEQ